MATVSTKKYSHNLKVDSYFIMWECLGLPSLVDSISVFLRILLPGGRRRSQAIYKFTTKGAGSPNIKDQISS